MTWDTDNTENHARCEQRNDIHLASGAEKLDKDNETLKAVDADYSNSKLSIRNLMESALRIRYNLSDALSMIAYVASISTWVLILLFAISSSKGAPSWMLPYVSTANAAAFAISIIFDELSCKLDGWGRGIVGSAMIIAALAGFGTTIKGNIDNDFELVSAGIFALFFLSFLPFILDRWGLGTHKRREAYKREKQMHDDNKTTNWSSGSGTSYDPIADMFGIPQPKPIPPIEITRDNILDDDWKTMINLTSDCQQVEIDDDGIGETQKLIEKILADNRHEKLKDDAPDYGANDDQLESKN